jgi:large repetitive protein
MRTLIFYLLLQLVVSCTLLAEISVNSLTPVVGENLTFTVKKEFNDEIKLITWNFGDGLDVVGGISTNHSYLKPGTFIVNAKIQLVNDEKFFESVPILIAGSKNSQNETVSSSTVTINTAENTVWSIDSDNDAVFAVDGNSRKIVAEIPVGEHPSSIAYDNSRRNILVTIRNEDSLVVINSQQKKIIKKCNLGWGTVPVAVVATANNEALLVLEGKKSFVSIDLNTCNITKKIELGAYPRRLLVDNLRKVAYVTRFITSNNIGIIWEVNLNNWTLNKTFEIKPDTTSIEASNSARGIANYVSGIALHREKNELWVVSKKDNVFAGAFRDPKVDISGETSSRSLLTKFDLSTGVEKTDLRLDIDNHSGGSDIIFSNNGVIGFILFQLNNIVEAIDLYKDLWLSPLTLKTDLAPDGLVLNEVTKQLFVHSLNNRTLQVFDLTALVNSGDFKSVEPETIKLVANDKFSTQELLGKQVFYNASDTRMAIDGYMSCASCHLDGDSDGQIWDFTGRGEGLRNTTSLRGIPQGMIHWSGNFDEMQDFEHDIRNAFLGKGFIDSEIFFRDFQDQGPLSKPKIGLSIELDALATYINSLSRFERSPFKNSDGTFTEKALIGGKLFFALDCSSCHSGTHFTDSKNKTRHNVDSANVASGKRLGNILDGFDTPSLIGIHGTAPYLHDGSALQLADVFKKGGHNINGKYGVLPDHLLLLVDFLNQLDQVNLDSNNNKISDLEELVKLAKLIDLDSDELDDAWEFKFFKTLKNSGSDDFDNDGISNLIEFKKGTNPADSNDSMKTLNDLLKLTVTLYKNTKYLIYTVNLTTFKDKLREAKETFRNIDTTKYRFRFLTLKSFDKLIEVSNELVSGEKNRKQVRSLRRILLRINYELKRNKLRNL